TKDESLVRRRGESALLQYDKQTMEIRLRSADTGGAWSLVESIMPAHTQGPPLHINTQEEETLYVLEGALLFQLGERQVEATAGSVVYIPRGSVHTFGNPYSEPARILGIISPAGFEGFFQEMAALAAQDAGGPPDVAQRIALTRK